MHSREILQKYLAFFQKQGHKQIPNLSLLPENDSTLLFVNSGMFPLVPYLSGEPHPLGKRLVNVQRSMRFEDLEEIGDNRHTTVFHMLGNWSLGDYFKNEQLEWAYQFFIEELGLDPNRLFASVFAGDQNAGKDSESIAIIKQIFAKYGIEAKENERIFCYGKEENWWQRGEAVGELGGPDSEIFYYLGEGSGVGKNPASNQNEFIEIGNNVFMQFRRTEKGWTELPQKNVDFGGGLERIAMVVQQKQDIFATDNFYPIIKKLEGLTKQKYDQDIDTTRAMRILADHLRAASMLAMDGVVPSNKDQGYCLRRFLRRMVRFGKNQLRLENISQTLFDSVIESIGWLYPELQKQKHEIISLFSEEESRFEKTLIKAYPKVKSIIEDKKNAKTLINDAAGTAKIGFDLYQSEGYPPELLYDEVKEAYPETSTTPEDYRVKIVSFFEKHQAVSRQGAEAKFKGGLANHSETVIQYHTATHLLHQALRQVLGTNIQQQGSNITNERLRFDFSYSQALTETEVEKIENLVSEKINQKLPVNFRIMEKAEAEKSGALHFFKQKYPDQVKVYYVGENLEQAFSKEFCGGPHVKNLSELKPIEIYKQEAVSKGVRRIYAKFV